MGLFSLLLLPTITLILMLTPMSLFHIDPGNANFRISLPRTASDLPNYSFSRELCSGNYNRYWLTVSRVTLPTRCTSRRLPFLLEFARVLLENYRQRDGCSSWSRVLRQLRSNNGIIEVTFATAALS